MDHAVKRWIMKCDSNGGSSMESSASAVTPKHSNANCIEQKLSARRQTRRTGGSCTLLR